MALDVFVHTPCKDLGLAPGMMFSAFKLDDGRWQFEGHKTIVLSERTAKKYISSFAKGQADSKLRELLNMDVMEFTQKRLSQQGLTYEQQQELVDCPRCRGTGIWAKGTKWWGKCFCCSGAARVSRLSEAMHYQKMHERAMMYLHHG